MVTMWTFQMQPNLAMPWIATGEDGGEVAVVLRDRVISDRVA